MVCTDIAVILSAGQRFIARPHAKLYRAQNYETYQLRPSVRLSHFSLFSKSLNSCFVFSELNHFTAIPTCFNTFNDSSLLWNASWVWILDNYWAYLPLSRRSAECYKHHSAGFVCNKWHGTTSSEARCVCDSRCISIKIFHTNIPRWKLDKYWQKVCSTEQPNSTANCSYYVIVHDCFILKHPVY